MQNLKRAVTGLLLTSIGCGGEIPVRGMLSGSSLHHCGDRLDQVDNIWAYYNERTDPLDSCAEDCDANFSCTSGPYGERYQCVEFVQRYFAQQWHIDLPRHGYAKDYCDPTNATTTLVPSNGAVVPGDILVLNSEFYSVGHVAVVKSVDGNQITAVEQNHSPSGVSVYDKTASNIGCFLHAKANVSVPTCQDQCTKDARQCADANTVQLCTVGDGCTTWVSQSCGTSSGPYFSNGAVCCQPAPPSLPRRPPCWPGNIARQMGDVDDDGWITESDADLVLRFTANATTFDLRQRDVADVNGDKSIDGVDANLILKYLQNPTTFPVCPVAFRGDVNCDGQRDSRDAQLVLGYVAKSVSYSGSCGMGTASLATINAIYGAAADLDLNTKNLASFSIDAADAVAILECADGKSTCLTR